MLYSNFPLIKQNSEAFSILNGADNRGEMTFREMKQFIHIDQMIISFLTFDFL